MFGYFFTYPKGSLKKQVAAFGRKSFPSVYKHALHHLLFLIREHLRSRRSIATVFCFVIAVVIRGQCRFLHPSFLQFIDVSDKAAESIDQRIANLANIFSVVLVVVGWLVTQFAIKEYIYFELLFRKIYIYTTFYLVVCTLFSLMVCSMLRGEPWFDLGSALISALLLIAVSLFLVTVLFINLVKAIGSAFFFSALENAVLQEAFHLAKTEIRVRKSNSLYRKFCMDYNFTEGTPPSSLLAGMQPIEMNIKSKREPKKEKDDAAIFADFFPPDTHEIRNVCIGILEKELKTLKLKGNNYFRPVGIGTIIPANWRPFFFDLLSGDVSAMRKASKAGFRIGKTRKVRTIKTIYLPELNRRLEKDIDAGKKEEVQMALAIYDKIFDLELNILVQC